MTVGMAKFTNQTIESAEEVAASSLEWASDTGAAIAAESDELFQWVQIQYSITFNSSATGDALLHIRKSADAGTTEDTEAVETYVKTIECSAGTTVTGSLMVYDFDYLDVGIENEDATYTLSWSAIYAGQKLTGLS